MNKDHIKTHASEAVKKSIAEKKQSLQRNTLSITDNIITIYIHMYKHTLFHFSGLIVIVRIKALCTSCNEKPLKLTLFREIMWKRRF